MFLLLGKRSCVGRVLAVAQRYRHHAGWIPRTCSSIANRSHAVVIKPFTVIVLALQIARRNLWILWIVVELSSSSPGMAVRSSEKSLEF